MIGRANRLLAPRVPRSPPPFPMCSATSPQLAAKATLTGNPVRPAVVAAAAAPYPAPTGAAASLVFGGSQGARILADIVPAAIGLPRPAPRARPCDRAAGP